MWTGWSWKEKRKVKTPVFNGDLKLCDCIGEMDVLPETSEICVLCL